MRGLLPRFRGLDERAKLPRRRVMMVACVVGAWILMTINLEPMSESVPISVDGLTPSAPIAPGLRDSPGLDLIPNQQGPDVRMERERIVQGVRVIAAKSSDRSINCEQGLSVFELQPDEWEKRFHIVEKSIAKYGRLNMSPAVSRVVISDHLAFGGSLLGGYNVRTTIYISSENDCERIGDEWFESILHAEIAECLMREFGGTFPRSEWAACNESSFEYGLGGLAAIRNGQASERIATADLEGGFLSEYSKSSLENDFSTISRMLFSGPRVYIDLARLHPRLLAKLRLAAQFYQSMDPNLTLAYFEAMTPVSANCTS